MKISDLDPLERRLLFMMRLCDALSDPKYRRQKIEIVAEYDEDTSGQRGIANNDGI